MVAEKHRFTIGIIVLIIGIMELFFVFSQVLPIVQEPGEYMESQIPEEDVRGPSAIFSWSTNGYEVGFSDRSSEGDSEITSWSWDFGDGETSTNKNPTHEYDTEDGSYEVTLTVTDENDEDSDISEHIFLGADQHDSGVTEGGEEFDLSFGDMMKPLSIAVLTMMLYLILFLIGAALTKAGWNIIRPKPESFTVKIKPKDIQVESIEQVEEPKVEDWTPVDDDEDEPTKGAKRSRK